MRPAIPHFLVKALVIPLAVATGLALWTSVYVSEPWAGLLVNLAAGFVGTVMTVLYVDVVLQRHNATQWQAVGQRVNMRVEGLANVSISTVRSALRIGTEVLDRGGDVANDAAKRRKMMTGVAEGVLTQEVSRIRDLDVKGWEVLSRNLQGASGLADRLLATFGPRLAPEITDGILNLQDIIGKVLSAYSIFPDIFGVPADRLPTKRDGSSTVPTQQALYANAETDLEQVLAVAAGLLRALQDGSDARA